MSKKLTNAASLACAGLLMLQNLKSTVFQILLKDVMSLLKIFFIATLFMVGCSESVHTEKYYKEHPKERDAVISQCKKLLKMNSVQKQDCQNANQAKRKASYKLDLTKNYGKAY